MLSDAEVRLLWPKLDPALKLILLTGQRPGEVAAMQRDHVADDWWQMPGKPEGDWPGPRTAAIIGSGCRSRRRRCSSGTSRNKKSSHLMRDLVGELKLERATPHDLRRTCLTRSPGSASAATPWTGSPITRPAT